ncbi:uncharacterized protein FFM5_15310 [Fusarium fujikuroi]|nr:uncharacterized protein FFM5_15310 [Fusarium fujikuroi]
MYTISKQDRQAY